MATPLYKYLKGYSLDDTTNKHNFSTYVFPSAKEDISASFQNDNYKLNFSKFALLNLDLSKMSTENFNTESPNVITNKGEELICSLRNYVANHEVVIKESMLSNNKSFYNPNELNTCTEKIFWKWLKYSNLMQFEPAIPDDDYTETVDLTIDENLEEDYFKEYLWKERINNEHTITNIIDEQLVLIDPYDNINKKIYKIFFSSTTNLKPFDRVILENKGTINIGFTDIKEFTIYNIDSTENGKNDIIYVYSDVTLIWNNIAIGTAKLNYEKVVQYIGEISNTNNVQTQDKTYTEVTAYIPDQNGQTPNILFRIKSDSNYAPSMQYPLLPIQDQPEIVGGEQGDNPIILNPEKYPGDQYAYFNVDMKYTNSSGLENRKSGEYYGIYDTSRFSERMNIPYTYPEFDGSNIDGLTIDFDTTHYTKMNIPSKKSNNFDEFNAQSFNNEPPKDFVFNAILWYYTVEDNTYIGEDVTNTQKRTAANLYAITFLNGVEDDKMPTYTKLVANGKQDGLSYIYSLNINFNIDNSQIIESYDENKIYSMFGFDLYNEIVQKLTITISQFEKIISNNITLSNEVNNVKSLLYTQPDIETINKKIDSLYKLLNLYKNLQIGDSESITTSLDTSINPPLLRLNNVDTLYDKIVNINTDTLYDINNFTSIVKNVIVPLNKDFMINVTNNDKIDVSLDTNLKINLDKDLKYKQSCDIFFNANDSTKNKKIDIYINNNLILSNINLPIDNNLNTNETIESIFTRWNTYPNIYPDNLYIKKITNNYYLMISLKDIILHTYKIGDVIMVNNLKLSYTENNIINYIDISNQYTIQNIEDEYLILNIDNSLISNLYESLTLQNNINSNIQEIKYNNYTQLTYISINKEYHIKITNIGENCVNYKLNIHKQ